MGTFRFPLPSSLPLNQAIAELAEHGRTPLRAGFKVLAALNEQKIETLARITVEHIDSLAGIDSEQVAIELGIETAEAGAVLTVTSFVVALISSYAAAADEIASIFAQTKLLEITEVASATRMIELVSARRSEIKKTLQLTQLAEETLPAFRGFEASLDLRLDFVKGQVDAFVPVVLAHLRTDLDSSRLFFQMKKSDVHRLLEELKSLAGQIEEAEKWANARRGEG